MDEEQIFTSELDVKFNSSQALGSIIDAFSIVAPKSTTGVFTPREVVKMAQECLIMAFKTIVDDMGREDVTEHLVNLLIVKTDLINMIDKRLLERDEDSLIKH